MSNTYFTVTGLNHYYGDSFLEKEMIVYLKKEFEIKVPRRTKLCLSQIGNLTNSIFVY